MRILVLGSGGREHAIIWKIKRDNGSDGIFALPGNGGISFDAECLSGSIDIPEQIYKISAEEKVDLTIVGPEVPLSMGVADVFMQKGKKIFGPLKKGARLESSKWFAKEFMKRYNVPTADFSVVDSLENGIRILEKKKFPCVVKYDGLAAGKGVQVSDNITEAEEFLHRIYTSREFGSENRKVIIEDCLAGTEMSYLIFTDTESFIPMVPAKDHKRVFDGDKGPNTGGMGCYSPPRLFNPEIEEIIKKRVIVPTLKGLQEENIDYRGVLYFGIMLTDKGPYVLEYNVRFGDPETQVILPRMESSLTEVMEAVIERGLNKIKIRWSDKNSVCVILASGGYPGRYEKGKEITGLDDAVREGVMLFHAGTKRENSRLVTSGGRVLAITSVAESLKEAREKAYRAAEKIKFEGKHYRTDIGGEKWGR
jgi:phosphoribosylamine---glycine ligase